MENENNACYEVKLNRIFNIQSKQNLIWLTVLFALPILYTIFNIINHTFDWQRILILCCGCLAIMIIKLLSSPKCLDVTHGTVQFQHRSDMLNLLLVRRIWGSTGNVSKYERTYTLYNIKSIEYLQTPFEKRFSCGHICICGDVNVSETEKKQRTFVIYGVKDFEDTSAWMKDFIKLSVDTQT